MGHSEKMINEWDITSEVYIEVTHVEVFSSSVGALYKSDVYDISFL